MTASCVVLFANTFSLMILTSKAYNQILSHCM